MRISLPMFFASISEKRKQIYSAVQETPQSNGDLIENKNKNEELGSVADLDPGSGAFFTPGSGARIRNGEKIRIRDEDPR
jgi:hypothetical protein